MIDLIANDAVADGTFDVQLSDERIKIHVPSAEKKKIEAVRIKRGGSVEFAALFPGLYLHAVAEGLRTPIRARAYAMGPSPCVVPLTGWATEALTRTYLGTMPSDTRRS